MDQSQSYEFVRRKGNDVKSFLLASSKIDGSNITYSGREETSDGSFDVYNFPNSVVYVRDLRGGRGIELVIDGEDEGVLGVKEIISTNTPAFFD